MSIFDSLIVSLEGQALRLKPEDDEGYIEYKLRLDKKNIFGIKKLTSQMNWRLEVGQELLGRKEAHYILGIKDDGTLGNLSESQIDETFDIFYGIVKNCGATLTYLDKKYYENSYLIYAIIKKIEKGKIKEINIAFVGPSQQGKTTTVSHLAYGQKDDGNGHARKLIFRHEHEKSSGVTSSIKKEIIGIRGEKIINYSTGIESSWENIVRMSDVIVNLIDLPGDSKYLKTLLFGLCSYKIDALALVVNINKVKDSSDFISFYAAYCESLNIPLVILYTHCDDDKHKQNDLVNGIFLSNLSNNGFDKLEKYICLLANTKNYLPQKEDDNNIFSTIETYFVPDSGTIFSGVMRHGKLSLDQSVILFNDKSKFQTKVVSIYKKQINSQTLYEGETGTIQLELSNIPMSEINKNMIIATKKYEVYSELLFTEIVTIKYSCNIQFPTLFVGNNVATICSVNNIEPKKFKISVSGVTIPEKEISIKINAFIKIDDILMFGFLI